MSSPSSLQADQLKEIGHYLQQKRIENSLTLEDIAALTKIRLPMLEALEAGNLEVLPELIYIKGFIRRYGEALKLDGQALVDRLSPSAEQLAKTVTVPRKLPEKVNPPKKEEPAPKQAERVLPEKPPRNTDNQKPNLNLYWLGILGGISFGIGYLFLKPPTIEPQPLASPSPTLEPSPIASPVIPPSPSPTPITTPAIPLTAAVEIAEPSWIRVTGDGKTLYEGTLPAGTKRNWTAEKTLNIRAGNAGGVKVAINDKPASPMGEPGQIGEKTFTPDANTP